MTNSLATKIRKHRLALGMNQTQFGAEFGVTQATASRWEKGSVPEAQHLTKLAANIGCSVKDLIDADFTVAGGSGPTLYIKGAVAAGVWREALEWDRETWVQYTGGEHVTAAAEHRFGLIVEGESMNQVYPPGTVLDCVSTLHTGEVPESGQRVVVVRRRFGGEVEATVKEYVRDGGKEWLVPRSYNPSFQVPIDLGAAEDGIEETVIVALVRGSYRPE